MAATTYPRPYRTRSSPILPGGDPQALLTEFRALQDTLDGVLDMLPQEATTAPPRPQPGMIRRAMAPWRPVAGQTTNKWVCWDATTSAWVYLAT